MLFLKMDAVLHKKKLVNEIGIIFKYVFTSSIALASGLTSGDTMRHFERKSLSSCDHSVDFFKPGIPFVDIKNKAFF